jgi:hypothetical protein
VHRPRNALESRIWPWRFLQVTFALFAVSLVMLEAAPPKVLTRLLQLNHERHEEEVRAGLHDKAQGARHRGRRQGSNGACGAAGAMAASSWGCCAR